MVGVNKVILIGNLGKDPEIVMFDNVKKASFPLATTEQYKNHEGIKIDETEWHNIVCWRGLADVADKFLRKSMQVYIEGKLKSRQWEDKDGNKRRTVEVVAENFKILSRNHGQNNNNIYPSNDTNNIGEFNADAFSFDTDEHIADVSESNLENSIKTRILPF
ncbi:MAG: single-stranded DNA-binding protein [Bacteroidales bacterium]